jgi:hypothetical protein
MQPHEDIAMKTTRLSVMSAIGLGLLAASGASQAESQYGYDPSGTGTATASARLNITVVVPQVILPMATTGLAHPGTNAATSVPTLFPRNVVATSMWTFAVTQAIVPGRVGGRATLGMTYTAATL